MLYYNYLMEKNKLIDIDFLNRLKQDTFDINPNLINDLFDIYFSSFDLKFSELKEFLQKNDLENVWKTSHYIKGQSATVGINSLATYFGEIETLAKQNQNTSYWDMINNIEKIYPLVKSEILIYRDSK